jgi:hypothetical protein
LHPFKKSRPFAKYQLSDGSPLVSMDENVKFSLNIRYFWKVWSVVFGKQICEQDYSPMYLFYKQNRQKIGHPWEFRKWTLNFAKYQLSDGSPLVSIDENVKSLLIYTYFFKVWSVVFGEWICEQDYSPMCLFYNQNRPKIGHPGNFASGPWPGQFKVVWFA